MNNPVLNSILRPVLRSPLTPSKGVRTILRREADGTITIVSLATAWKAAATREADGTLTVAKA